MGKKILLVEDDNFLRELLAKKLRNEGFEVIEAVDGEQGLQETEEKMPDIILLDLILPGMDGFQFLEKKKEKEKVKEIPVIILSNLGQREEIEKGLKLGAVDYMVKAYFSPFEIVDKVKQYLKE